MNVVSMLRKLKNKIMQYVFLHMQNLQSAKELNDLESLKKRFKKVGVKFTLGKDYTVVNPKFMEFGDEFGSKERFRIEAISNYEGQQFSPDIKIGRNVNFNTDVHIGCIDRVEIGDNCLFASRIYITDHDHGETTLKAVELAPAKRKLVSKGPVIIKNNVWVGEGVSILAGVTIGENSIIATNSVVTKDIPRNSVAGGTPAKIIKKIENI